ALKTSSSGGKTWCLLRSSRTNFSRALKYGLVSSVASTPRQSSGSSSTRPLGGAGAAVGAGAGAALAVAWGAVFLAVLALLFFTTVGVSSLLSSVAVGEATPTLGQR